MTFDTCKLSKKECHCKEVYKELKTQVAKDVETLTQHETSLPEVDKSQTETTNADND